MRVLGIDPGTLAMGYGVVEDKDDILSMVDYGVLTSSSRVPIVKRLHILYQGLLELINRYQPAEVAVEEPFVARNVRSALAVGRAQTVAILAAASRGLPVYSYTPAQVKQSIAGYGRSSKEQVQEMVKIQLGLPQPPQPHDAADALAIALCHLQQTHLARLLAESQ